MGQHAVEPKIRQFYDPSRINDTIGNRQHSMDSDAGFVQIFETLERNWLKIVEILNFSNLFPNYLTTIFGPSAGP